MGKTESGKKVLLNRRIYQQNQDLYLCNSFPNYMNVQKDI